MIVGDVGVYEDEDDDDDGSFQHEMENMTGSYTWPQALEILLSLSDLWRRRGQGPGLSAALVFKLPNVKPYGLPFWEISF